jgi:hypothetical protein
MALTVSKTIPEIVKTHNIEKITIDPRPVIITDSNGENPTTHYYGEIETRDENGQRFLYRADLTDEWTGVSGANKTIIKAFLKKVVELCLEAAPTDITGDIFS